MTYASDQDVRLMLGTISNRLPDWITIADFLDVANGYVVEALSTPYPDEIPTFTGPAATVVKWAEAKLAAAEILDAIRVNLPEDQHGAAERLRESAFASLSGGVVGFPIGGVAVDNDGNPATPDVRVQESPRVSSYTPMSAFPDPYDAVRRDTSEASY